MNASEYFISRSSAITTRLHFFRLGSDLRKFDHQRCERSFKENLKGRQTASACSRSTQCVCNVAIISGEAMSGRPPCYNSGRRRLLPRHNGWRPAAGAVPCRAIHAAGRGRATLYTSWRKYTEQGTRPELESGLRSLARVISGNTGPTISKSVICLNKAISVRPGAETGLAQSQTMSLVLGGRRQRKGRGGRRVVMFIGSWQAALATPRPDLPT